MLDSYQPPQPAYKALRKKLAEARGKKGGNAPAQSRAGRCSNLSTDKKTKQTILMTDERVPQLREKLGLPAVRDDMFYDKPLADAVAQFQKEKGLPADRPADATRRSTRSTASATSATTRSSSPTWSAGAGCRATSARAHVVLNIPDFTLQVYEKGASIWKTRVVVGKAGGHATPLLSETMKFITVNPTWNVPPSIVYNEYLPALQQDPTVLKRMGLNLQQRPRRQRAHLAATRRRQRARAHPLQFPEQVPGLSARHAGQAPVRARRRAYSHGCMRVQNPTKYAEIMTRLGMPGSSYTAEKIKSMYGNSEIDLRFTNQIPVHITYQTAFVDDAGHLQIREDIYGRDARLLAALKDGNRRAEIPVARARPSHSRPPVRLPNGFATTATGTAAGRSSTGCSVTRSGRSRRSRSASAGQAGAPRDKRRKARVRLPDTPYPPVVNHPGRAWRRTAIFRHTPPLANLLRGDGAALISR